MTTVVDREWPVMVDGFIDGVSRQDDTLRIHGWVLGADESRPERFDIRCGDVHVKTLSLETGLPSADVAAVYPRRAGSEACRFRVVSELPAAGGDFLVRATPIVNGRPARSLFFLVTPSLPLPPAPLTEMIGGGFLLVTLDMLGHFIERGALRPSDRVLDVGCGIGRIAYGLAYYLDDGGRYEGFDIIRPAIDWASTTITPRRPNFRFRVVDVYNGLYNGGGTLDAETFSFPYGDAAFDFVILTSVLTHIRSREVRHYFDEIARVLAPGGRVFATAFLLTADAKAAIARGAASQLLRHPYGGGFAVDPQAPEGAIGYEETTMREWAAASGLTVTQMFPGSWWGRPHGLSYQDVLLLERADGPPPRRRLRLSIAPRARVWGRAVRRALGRIRHR